MKKKMVFVQQVLSWFGRSVGPAESDEKEARVSEPEEDAESDEKELESVTPASDLVTEFNGDSMGINGYTAPPSNDKNGALAVLNPVMEDLQEYLRKHHIWMEIKVHRLCNNTGRNNWRCKRVREGDFKYCAKCRKSVYASGKRRWNHHVVYDSKSSDRNRGFGVDDPDYITPEWVLEQRKVQGNRCYYCEKEMQTRMRTAGDGLQPERLTESLPHLKAICVLACGDCNRRSHYRRFCPYPISQAGEYELDEFHFFRGIPPTNLPSRLSIYRENRRRLAEQCQPQE